MFETIVSIGIIGLALIGFVFVGFLCFVFLVRWWVIWNELREKRKEERESKTSVKSDDKLN
jgi:hypothetical protein